MYCIRTLFELTLCLELMPMPSAGKSMEEKSSSSTTAVVIEAVVAAPEVAEMASVFKHLLYSGAVLDALHIFTRITSCNLHSNPAK